MRKIQTVLLLTLAILILSASTGWARVYIDITKPFTRKLPLAMPSFSPLPGATVNKLAAEGARILTSDLDFTGLFEMIDKGAYLERVTGEKITYKAWSRVGAELLISGFYRISGASMTLNMRLYDITEKKQLIGKQYTGLPVDLPQIMHRFADEVMMVVTGERSVFSSQIAFVGARQGAQGVVKEIYRMNFDGSGLKKVTQRGNIALYPTWSPDGRFLTYTSYVRRRPAIFVHALAGGSGRVVINKPGVNLTPRFTPDGTRLGLSMSYTGKTNVFIADLSGKVVNRLTDGWGIEVAPTFSPDGKKVAYVSDRGGSPQIYVADIDGKNPRRISFGFRYCAAPEWSPRGDRIVFQAMVGNTFQVVSMTPKGGGMQVLTRGWGGGEDPTYSPDGRLIAYSSRKSGNYQIYVMTATGTPVKKVTNLPGDNTDPAWSPRGVRGR